MKITFTGDPQKDAALLQEAVELQRGEAVESDTEIETKIRDANVDFSNLRAGTNDPVGGGGKIPVDTIRGLGTSVKGGENASSKKPCYALKLKSIP